MGEENNPLWGTATIFINGEKLGTLENESKTITMEQKQFNEGDKVLLNGNAENIYVISKVIHNYRGQGGCRYHLRKENEEYGSNLSFVRGSKLSAYEGKECYVKAGDWVRSLDNNEVFQVANIGYDTICKLFYVEDNTDIKSYNIEPYSPKEGEFVSVSNVQNRWIRQWNGGYEYSVGCKDAFMSYKQPTTITELRPATEEEKQILIKVVEDKFSKTYCEKTKEWVDVNKGTIEVELVVKPIMDFVTEVRNKTEEYANANAERFRQIAEANKEVVELLVKVGVLQDPTNPSDVYSYNVGKSDYAKKSPIQPWMMWQLWDWLTPWDCDIIKRLYRDKEGTSRIEDYNKIIHICKERIRQLNEEK